MNKIYEILGIAPTKDVGLLKEAYRNQLVTVNPEDNPEGFKALREAYEEALNLANQVEETSGPIAEWISEIESVYNKLESRKSKLLWEALFEADICTDLDTCDEAREAFLVFLMDHFRLPSDIWQLIEETFKLESHKEELYEKFPKEFIDFATEDLANKSWFDFNLIEGEARVPVDDYIQAFIQLRKMNDNRQYEDSESALALIENAGLSHPAVKNELMRYAIANEESDRALTMARELDQENTDDAYITYYVAFVYYSTQVYDRAVALCQELIDDFPTHYGAHMILAAYALDLEDFEGAKKRYLDMIPHFTNDEAILNGIKRANEGIIVKLEEKLKLSPDDEKSRFELAWCYFQNDRFEEAWDLLEPIQVTEDNRYEYQNIAGRLLMELYREEEALPHLKEWLELVKEERLKDEAEQNPKITEKLPIAYYLISRALFKKAVVSQDEVKANLKAEAIQMIDQAIQAENNQNDQLISMQQKAYMYFAFEDYRRCIDVCDQMIQVDADYYPAYIYRQKSAFELDMNKQVIDDYYEANRLYPGNAEPYINAIKVYMRFDMTDDAKAVIDEAYSKGVTSMAIELEQYNVERVCAKTNEARQRIFDKIKDLYLRALNQESDLIFPAECLHYMALIRLNSGEHEEALKIINEKIEKHETAESVYLKGVILLEREQYNEVIDIMEDYKSQYSSEDNGLYILGRAYQYLRKYDQAIDNYQVYKEKFNDSVPVNERLAEVYLERFRVDRVKDYLDKSIAYGQHLLELEESERAYYLMGEIYEEGNLNQQAITSYKKSSEFQPDSPYQYCRIGNIYKRLNIFEEAEAYYKQSIEKADDNYLQPYYQLALVYSRHREVDKSEAIYQGLAERFKLTKQDYNDLIEMFLANEAWEKAGYWRNKQLQEEAIDQIDYYIEMGYLYHSMGDLRAYRKCVKKLRRIKRKHLEVNQQVKIINFLADFYFMVKKDFEEGMRWYQTGIDLIKDSPDFYNNYLHGIVYDTLNAHRAMGQKEALKTKMDDIWQYIKGHYSSEENYLGGNYSRKLSLYNMAYWSLYSGDVEKAKYYFEKMKDAPLCAFCQREKCMEEYDIEGKIAEYEGKYAKALVSYKKALMAGPDRIEYLFEVEQMEDKMKAKE